MFNRQVFYQKFCVFAAAKERIDNHNTEVFSQEERVKGITDLEPGLF